jgi:hypothetical protein
MGPKAFNNAVYGARIARVGSFFKTDDYSSVRLAFCPINKDDTKPGAKQFRRNQFSM